MIGDGHGGLGGEQGQGLGCLGEQTDVIGGDLQGIGLDGFVSHHLREPFGFGAFGRGDAPQFANLVGGIRGRRSQLLDPRSEFLNLLLDHFECARRLACRAECGFGGCCRIGERLHRFVGELT